MLQGGRLGAHDRERLLTSTAEEVRRDHERGEDRPDDRRVLAEAGADQPERFELLAQYTTPRIGGCQAGEVGRARAGIRGYGVGDRARARGPVAESPRLGEALGARLRLEVVPAELTREAERLGGEVRRRVLGGEVVHPEADRYPVDGIAPQRRHHALTVRHRHGKYGHASLHWQVGSRSVGS